MLTKICPRCHAEKSLEEFGNNRGKPYGKSTYCRICLRALSAARYLANPEKVKAQSLAWQRANRAKRNARCRAARNPEKDRAKGAAYRLANPEKTKARHALYQKLHPRQAAQVQSRRRARQRGLPDTWTDTQRQFMMSYWHYACAICGNEEGFLWTLADDHWIPINSSKCPGTVAENMLPLCHMQRSASIGTPCCNSSKGSKDPHAWLVARYGARKAAKIERAIAVYFVLAKEQP